MIKSKKGIALLLSIIVSAIAMSISMGIAFILLEELKLSRINKNSFGAFFAADSGADCALYWDLKAQSDIDPLVKFFINPSPSGILKCGDDIPNLTITIPMPGSVVTKFSVKFSNKCADVIVEKTNIEIKAKTRIQSLGKNIACGAISNTNTVQRGIEIAY